MIEFNLFDNILDFIAELNELLLEDWRKFKFFIKENKDYMIWLFILLITLQFTDVMSLGTSWNKYCKKHNIQSGGEGNAPPPSAEDSAPPTEPESSKDKGGNAPPGDGKDKGGEGEEGKKPKGEEADEGDESVKGVDKKLSLFNKLSGKLKSSAGAHGMAGPVLGNLGGIFSAVEGMFTLIAVVLIFIGILSLPVLVFLVITYCIIKMMVGKLALY